MTEQTGVRMTQIGMSDQSDERRRQFETEALRIVDAAKEKGLVLRLLGSLAFRLHCPEYGYLQKQLGRAYTDIDYAAYRDQASKMTPLLTGLGYREDAEINLLYAGQRMIFNNNGLGIHMDIFFDKLSFCHDIVWKNRLQDDYPTIPLAEMLMEKMQIVKINEKDIIDTIMLLLEHPLGDHDRETINMARISSLCAQDWGLWRTLTMNLGKVGQMVQGYAELNAAQKTKLAAQVEEALDWIEREPKTMSWKLRSKIGDRVKWYQEVDEVV
jgi:hypothetical protein